MEKGWKRAAAAASSVAVAAMFFMLLLVYTLPVKEPLSDLSLGYAGETAPPGWRYDQKGWRVYTREGGKTRDLLPDGAGGFTGLPLPGETVYLSRTLAPSEEAVTLRISAGPAALAVFVDGSLLCTDFPCRGDEGELRLPMLGWDRQDPVVTVLPPSREARTLTIAQATDPRGGTTVRPCAVTMYTGFAYEDGLISEAFQSAVPVVFSFVAMLLLLTGFLWQIHNGRWDLSLLLLTLPLLFWSAVRLGTLRYAQQYFNRFPLDLAELARGLTLASLLFFMGVRLPDDRRRLLWVPAGIHTAAWILTPPNSVLSGWVGLAAVLWTAGLSLLLAVKKELFFRVFSGVFAAGLVFRTLSDVMSPSLRLLLAQQLGAGLVTQYLWQLTEVCMTAAITAELVLVVEQENTRRSEARALKVMDHLTAASVQELRLHQQEVRILRHDMVKHLTFLRQNVEDPRLTDYLDQLIGQQASVRPVIQTRNRSLDIIVNAKLGAAIDMGVRPEIVRAEVPEVLPLSDPELCSVLMNVLDNALQALEQVPPEEADLQLDFHVKNGYFVMVCQNSMAPAPAAKKEDGHGLGLKIIQRIMDRHGGLMETAPLAGAFRITLAVPLDQERR